MCRFEQIVPIKAQPSASDVPGPIPKHKERTSAKQERKKKKKSSPPA